ncbi:Protein of unknown function [Sphingomonas guangdongensis]|uniref:TIGR03899 family protein n=1 Tax=Sphingomonas guangdongensis TaxID=1141890 RepID=A0A285QY54_9SPHN|nr:DUF2806 domain-containing protein [Sphingomonas guangdongensis]SOB86756.1 Protein of unknown function [Sphingomonas guangdongensis]
MTEEESTTSTSVALNAATSALTGLPPPIQRSAIKAFNQLVGALMSYPVAWADRAASKIESKTSALRMMDAAVAKAAAESVVADPEVIKRAADNLLRKEYRKQNNKEQIMHEAVVELAREPDRTSVADSEVIDEDWLNVFEQYAETASTDRMRGIWARVLAGEIRKSGTFSIRTLRFLSEFSQEEAFNFSKLAQFATKSYIARSAVKELFPDDVRPLLFLENAGLINGATGIPLEVTLTFDNQGMAYVFARGLVLRIHGKPEQKSNLEIIALTQVGSDIASIIPISDEGQGLRSVWKELSSDQTLWADLCKVIEADGALLAEPIEALRPKPDEQSDSV